ncbi:hypothetical protein GCM10022226_50040 [Sphaerisporangium flaviroseum]|uniref:Uncharacterized protein n=1 Tax=Sphaerisporangium flaviroseum TaxID=509199 RepID=A0ABP7IP99_9ACTN
MTGGLKVAVAVAIGYLLGRHRRFKLAVALAVAGATGRLGGAQGNLLEQGMKLVSSSPELEKIVSSVRGELFQAGKAAAKAATSRQVTSLSTKLQERAEALQHAANVAAGMEEAATGAAEGVTGAAEGATKTARGRVGGLRDRATGGVRAARARIRRPAEEEAEEEEPYEDEYDEFEDEEEYEEEPPSRRGPAEPEGRGRPSGRGVREPLDDEDEDEDEGPGPRGRVVRDEPPRRSRPIRRTRG